MFQHQWTTFLRSFQTSRSSWRAFPKHPGISQPRHCRPGQSGCAPRVPGVFHRPYPNGMNPFEISGFWKKFPGCWYKPVGCWVFDSSILSKLPIDPAICPRRKKKSLWDFAIAQVISMWQCEVWLVVEKMGDLNLYITQAPKISQKRNEERSYESMWKWCFFLAALWHCVFVFVFFLSSKRSGEFCPTLARDKSSVSPWTPTSPLGIGFTWRPWRCWESNTWPHGSP